MTSALYPGLSTTTSLFGSRRAVLENNLADLEILARDMLAEGADLDAIAQVIGLWDATRCVLEATT